MHGLQVPVVSDVRIITTPGSEATFQLGERILARVTFDRAIRYTGTPRLALTIGLTTRQVSVNSASLNNGQLNFLYYVQSSDVDTNGISVGASALTVTGGTITATDSTITALLGLGTHAIANSAGHKVDGGRTKAPEVTYVGFSSSAGSDSSYAAGDQIRLSVYFDRAVAVTGVPRLALTIGSRTRYASHDGGTGNWWMGFRYTVQASDVDADGISVGANALTLNGGTVRLLGSPTTNANLGLGSHAIANNAAHKVNSSAAVFVTSVWLSVPASDSTYQLGELISVVVYFSRQISSTGRPRLALTIGSQTRQADWFSYAYRDGRNGLQFRYYVQASDVDADGLSISASALTLNSGTITAQDGSANAALGLGSHAIANDAAYKVNGGLATAPSVTNVWLGNWQRDSTYTLGDEVIIGVGWDRAVVVTGTPQLALTIGAQTRQASYYSGAGSPWTRFRYTVQASDMDADGISIGASALALNGGTITLRGSSTTNANLGLGSRAIANDARAKVDGSQGTGVTGVSIAAPTSNDSTFKAGDPIDVTVTFSGSVDLGSSRPYLHLGIGSWIRAASYVSGGGTSSLLFRYWVRSSDADADGISVAADALCCTGRVLASGTSTNAGVGLGSHAIANSAAHKVDGSTAGAPRVSDVRITSTPASDSTYELGERIVVYVVFDRRVGVTGTPQLALKIGSQTRQATEFGWGGGISFAYVVQSSDIDVDGISVAADALTLNGGRITSSDGSANAVLGLGSHVITNDAAGKVNGGLATAPSVDNMRLWWPYGGADSTYTLGDEIDVTVLFNRQVAVTGVPQLALTIGSQTRQAHYTGVGRRNLEERVYFRYTVQASDRDADGISIGASALTLNGGAITLRGSSTTNANLGLGSRAISNDARAKVDGSRGTGVTGVSIAAPTSNDSTFKAGDPIDVTVTFSGSVDLGSSRPYLRLGIGSSTRLASYVSGRGTSSLLFRYWVQSSDADADGISVAANPLCCTGRVLASGTSTNAGLGLGSHAIANSAAHKVDGSTASTGAPRVQRVGISTRPASDSTYQLGKPIIVLVAFNRPIRVTGSPRLALTIGSQTRQADLYHRSSDILWFRYYVQASDVDADGISIGANALTVTGGTITSSDGSANAVLGLGDYAVTNHVAHKVNGGLATAPSVSGVYFSWPYGGADSTYTLGNEVFIEVSWDRSIAVTGTPQLALTIGSQTRQASYFNGSRQGTQFRYTVQASDMDSDGISIGASALTLNGGTITLRGSSSTNANLGLGSRAISNDARTKVDGSRGAAVTGVSIAAPTSNDSTFKAGDPIDVTVTFSGAVDLGSSRPYLRLGIGSSTRTASYVSGGGTSSLLFRYWVRSSDADADGISVEANALCCSGWVLASGASTNAGLGLGGHAVANSAAHKVDGSTAGAPRVSDVRITTTPASDSTYALGELISVTVEFDRSVSYTGAPQLALTVGSQTRQASLAGWDGEAELRFSYAVQASDRDLDGISVGASALTLNGGTITALAGATSANLGLGTHAIATEPAQKVDGSRATAPSVSGVEITSTPVSDSTYERGERIDLTVEFDRPVAVTGAPRLALTIGSQTRQAAYAAGTGTMALTFRYTVAATDADSDGLSVGANALALNDGTINLAAAGATAATLGLGTHAIANASAHKVDGSQAPAPSVSRVVVLPNSFSDSTYTLDDEIIVRVYWDRAVDVTGTPQLALTIGSRTRQASALPWGIIGQDRIVFRYYVQSSDRDADGLSIGASALTLNGGAINDMVNGSAAVLGLGAHAVTNAPTHKVDGSRTSASEVEQMILTSSPLSDRTYNRGETITVRIWWNRPVAVTGTPQVALTIGSQTRQASYYYSGADLGFSGPSITYFRYTVQASDRDSVGLSIGATALTLNGGTITNANSTATNASLNLGTHAIVNDGNHRVDGSQVSDVVTFVSYVGVSSDSCPDVGDDTCELGDKIVVFAGIRDRLANSGIRRSDVEVAGTPQMAIAVGTQTRYANYARTRAGTLYFSYFVQSSDRDTDGVHIPADALRLNGGMIRRRGTQTDANIAHAGSQPDVGTKVDGSRATAPAVRSVTIASQPDSGYTYQLSENIRARVRFSRAVAVTGTPRLALKIGSQTRQATYASGTGTESLEFGYAVQSSDMDADGISIGASALSLNGATITLVGSSTTNANLDLGTYAVPTAAAHKVDGSLGVPGVSGVAVAAPDVGDAFERGEEIEVTVTFTSAVDVTGTPQVALTIGGVTKQASYASGTGTASLVFRYEVVAADADSDGLSIGASALALNGGTIKAAGGTVDAVLGLGSNAIANSAAHKVAGGTFTASSVSGVTISSSPASDSTYGLGERVEVRVDFGRAVDVTGTPQLALTIGSRTRQADYASGTGAKSLVFGYAVVAGDADADGISVGTSALTLNSGTIADARDSTTAASLGLGANAISNAPGHKVDATRGPPGVSALSIGSPDVGDAFERGESIEVTVTFNKAVDVTGTPRLALGIGSQTRWANYASGTGTASLVFRYVVVQADADADGLSIGASALALNGGTIDVAGGTTDAVLGLGGHAVANSTGHKVAGGTFTAASVSGATIASTPAGASTYGLSERIEVEVTFNRAVAVTGTPQLALFVGTDTVQADYASGTGTKALTFGYAVVASDADADGISIGASALTLNGGTIADARDASAAASLGLGSNAISNEANHRVDGSQGPPGVVRVSIGSPPVGDTFERGDTIAATVTFNKSVDVTGGPQLALTIGSSTRQASYASGTSAPSLLFRYVVASGDADADGLSIGASALSLNGGTIDVAGGTTDAVLGLGAAAVSNSAGHKVAGGTFTAAAVSGVAVSSAPAAGDSTYVLGERIEVAVTFNRRVAVTGTPRLALTIGAQTRQASYASGTGTATLAFRYTVAAMDSDSTGIGIGASALSLNSGTINDARDGATAASLDLGVNAIANDAAHKVDGSQGPPGVSGLSIGSPVVGDTFERGDTIAATVTFNKSVDVTGTPQLALSIGAATRQASYASGTGTASLVFRYVVASGDADADGLSIGAAALALNGGTIDVAGGTTDAVLDLGAAALSNSVGHKVAGGTFTAAAVSGVAVSSAPAAGDSTYVLGERVEVTVTFSRPVSVTGAPRLALTVGAQTRQAAYASGTGTTSLVFGYTVVAADADADGIGVGAAALTLNGGAIADARDGATAATLGLGANAIANDAAHKVDGALGPPGVSGLSIASPMVGDTFERGDTVVATVTFNKAVDVTGTPQLALSIGSQTRQASYASGTGTASLVFRYLVVQADADANGLSIGAAALGLNGGTIDVAGGTTDAVLGLGAAAVTNSAGHKVAGGTFTAASVSGASITSTPAGASTYGLSERIEVTVAFNRAVDVTGTPQLALTIGAATRQAAYASGTGTRSLVFGYEVVAGDADANGIGVGAGALALNGGTVADARDGTTAASLGLGSSAIADAAAHKVDGSQGPPGVSGLSIGSPDVSDTFERGERIEVAVTFNKAVDVTGTPQLALTVGTQTRQASYASGTGTATLVFAYTVVAADADADGISIGASALALNGGTIDVAGGTTDAVLGLGRARDHEQREPQGGGRHLHGVVGDGGRVHEQPRRRRHLRAGRADRGRGDVRARRGRDGRAAARADGRDSDATGVVCERDRHEDADVRLHGGGGGRGQRRVERRCERAGAERRHDQRRAGRFDGGQPGLGFQRRVERGVAQGGRRAGSAGCDGVVDRLASGGRHVRAWRDDRGQGGVQQGGGGDGDAAAGVGDREHDETGELRCGHGHGHAGVPVRGGGCGRGRGRAQHRRERAGAERRHDPTVGHDDGRGAGAGRERGCEQHGPQGGWRHVHGVCGERRGDHERAVERQHVRSNGADRGRGVVHAPGDGDGRAAAGADDRHADAAGGVRERERHDDAGVRLHGAGCGRGQRRVERGRERFGAERRCDRRRARRRNGGEPGTGFERGRERGGAQGGRQPGSAGGDWAVDQCADGGRHLRARRDDRGQGRVQQGGGGDGDAASGADDRLGDEAGELRCGHGYGHPGVPVPGGERRRGRGRVEHRRERVGAERRDDQGRRRDPGRDAGAGRERGDEQRGPQGGGRHVHDAGGDCGDDLEHAGEREHVPAGRVNRGEGGVRPSGDGDGLAASGADDRDADAASQLRGRFEQGGHAGVRLRDPSGGRGHRRDQHRHERARAERRSHQRCASGRDRCGAEPGRERGVERRVAQGERQPGAAGRRGLVCSCAAGGHDVRAGRHGGCDGDVQQGGGRDGHAAAGVVDRFADATGGLRIGDGHDGAGVPVRGGAGGRGRGRVEHRRERLGAERRNDRRGGRDDRRAAEPGAPRDQQRRRAPRGGRGRSRRRR